MNREDIMKIIPHREPMLLIDEVFLEEEGKAVGYYHVKGDEFFLQGHFPGNPIVPGVIQCEMMAQSACVMFKDKMEKEGTLPLYTGLNKVRFKGIIKPGDTIKIETKLIRESHPMYLLSGRLSVDGKLCMSGEFSFVIMEER